MFWKIIPWEKCECWLAALGDGGCFYFLLYSYLCFPNFNNEQELFISTEKDTAEEQEERILFPALSPTMIWTPCSSQGERQDTFMSESCALEKNTKADADVISQFPLCAVSPRGTQESILWMLQTGSFWWTLQSWWGDRYLDSQCQQDAFSLKVFKGRLAKVTSHWRWP